jgi:uncharacterized membrane protein
MLKIALSFLHNLVGNLRYVLLLLVIAFAGYYIHSYIKTSEKNQIISENNIVLKNTVTSNAKADKAKAEITVVQSDAVSATIATASDIRKKTDIVKKANEAISTNQKVSNDTVNAIQALSDQFDEDVANLPDLK